MKAVPALFAAALLAFAAGAAAASAPVLQVLSGWSRPAVAGTNGVGYLTVANHGAKADSLVEVKTPLAERVEMHAVSTTGGVMKMAQVNSVPVPAGGKTDFGPGGYHLMLIGLKKPLSIGDHVPVTLRFASGARVKAMLDIAVMPPTM